MGSGFIHYSQPLEQVLEHFDQVQEQGGYLALTLVTDDAEAEQELRLCNVVDLIEALAEGKLARDGLYKVEYVAELVEEA